MVSNVGTWMESVALAYYVADTTGKASWSAIVGAAAFIPGAFLGPVGSAMADRLNRKHMIIGTQAGSAVIAAVLAIWVGSGSAGPEVIAILSFLAGCIGAFGFPAYQTVLPDLVPREHLVAAVGLSNAQWNLGRIIGPALAALVMSIGGIGAALWCNAISFAAVIVAISLIKLPHRDGARRPIFAALGDGVRFARGHPDMRRMLALMAATVFIGAPFIAFVSQMATNVFDGDSEATSFLVTAQGIGAVTAAFTMGGLTKRIGVWRLMTGAIGLMAPVLVLYAISPRLWTAALCLAAIGLLYGYAFTSFAGVAQQTAPDEMRGRVLAVNTFVLGLCFPVGTLVQGAIADEVGLREVTAASGIALFAVAAVLTLPHLRRLRAAPPAAAL